MSGVSFAAVVLAGGRSSRLPPLKPLLSIDGVPAVVRTAYAFRDVGIEPLIVIGFAAGELAQPLRAHRLHHVLNEDYERGMYSSLRTGVRGIDPWPDWLFVQPADCPLVRGETIGHLMRATRTTEGGAPDGRETPSAPRALIPTYRGQRGHPPLLAAALLPLVLSAEPPGGLRDLLVDVGDRVAEIPVDDEGVLLDMDDADGYARVRERAASERLPDADDCEALLRRRATPTAVAAHSRAVRDVALRLAGAANAAGLGLNLPLLEAAALVHDVARDRPDHAVAAASLLEEEGYPRVARIVRYHMHLAGPPADPPAETEVLYLADKLVRGETVVTLEERRRRAAARFSGDPQAQAAAAAKLAAAVAVARSLERVTGRPLADLPGQSRPGSGPPR